MYYVFNEKSFQTEGDCIEAGSHLFISKSCVKCANINKLQMLTGLTLQCFECQNKFNAEDIADNNIYVDHMTKTIYIVCGKECSTIVCKKVSKDRCYTCGLYGTKRCVKCKSDTNINYCSKECQVANWPEHKHLYHTPPPVLPVSPESSQQPEQPKEPEESDKK